MYHINSKEAKPDIAYLKEQVEEMMKRGIHIGDVSFIYNTFLKDKEEMAVELAKNYGISNPNSSKELIKFISQEESSEVYEACFIDGKWTTNKDALKTLSLLGYQFATDILEYRQAKKYAESIKSMSDAADDAGNVHPIVNLSKTNRINYSSPALMNIPKSLLWHVVKPNNPGNILISADIKNQEPNILINILGIESLKPALEDPKGLYEHMFERVYSAKANINILVTDGFPAGKIENSTLAEIQAVPPVPPVYYAASQPSVQSTYYNNVRVRAIDATNIVAKVGSTDVELPSTVLIETIDNEQHEVPVIWGTYNKKLLAKRGIISFTGELQGIEIRCEGIYRKEFKVAWNMMTYGAGKFGVEKSCKHISGKMAYDFFMSLKELKIYRDRCTKMSKSLNQKINTYFGTTLSAGENDPNRLKRILMDLPIQGTAADILSLLIKHCREIIESKGLKDKLHIVYTRHDEIIFEADKDWASEIGIDGVNQVIRDMVEHQVDDWTPFKLEVNVVKADRSYLNESDYDLD